MRARSYLALLALAAAAAFGLAACGGGGGDAGSAAPAAQTGETTDEKQAEPTAMTPAADLRATLDALLAEHASLAMLATQKGYDGDADFEAAAAALDENSVELSEAIASVSPTRPRSSS